MFCPYKSKIEVSGTKAIAKYKKDGIMYYLGHELGHKFCKCINGNVS